MMLAVVCLLARAALGAGADTAPPPAPREGFSVDLGGEWRVQPLVRTDEGIAATIADPDPTPEAWGSMQVPGQATQIRQGKGDVWKGFDAKKLHGIWLEREVVIPAEWAIRRIILRGELVEQPLIVRVNGRLVGTLVPPGDGLNLTNAIAPVRTHTLRLAVLAGEAAPDGAPQHVTGPIGRLGIAGSLRLDAVAPRVALEGVFLMPSVRAKRLGARVRFHAAAAEKRVTLRAAVTETDGSPVRQFETTISVGKGESFREVFFPWRDPVLWELDRPHLYRITIAALGNDGTPLDTWGPQTFGFREFRVDGKEMLLNEHPCRFRLLWHWGVGEKNIAFYQGIGFNAIAIQPRDGRWFEGAGANGDIDALADMCDRRGIALIATGKVINGIDRLVRDDSRIRSYFERTSFTRIWRYANHPSILAWNISLNVGNSHEEWMPPHIGLDPQGERRNHPVAAAAAIVDRLDPTRSVMAHAGGNIAPITSANVYLNFVPLQEREEWLSAWSKDGQRPFAAIEFGTPYSANFFRRCAFGDPMFTEYSAIFLGDRAYELEQPAYVEQVEKLTQTNSGGHGSASIYERDGDRKPLQTFAAEHTAFFPVVGEFVRRTNRAWRAFGHNAGSHQWMWNIGFGGTPSGPMGAFFYEDMTGTDDLLRQRPEWANEYYDAYRETMQPLLVFIGGRRERFTERDHTFFPGETVEKQIIAVWDGGWEREIACQWEVMIDEKQAAGDTLRLKLKPGEIRKVPIRFDIPNDATFGGEIALRINDDQGAQLASDTFHFNVIPRPPKLKTALTIVLLWDPAGESGPWIRQLGLKADRWKPGNPLPPGSTLIIGRNALSHAEHPPFTRADLDAGLSVLVLEQQGEALQRLGFRVADTFSRRLFARLTTHPALQTHGLEDSQRLNRLADWRGSASLLPEYIPLDDFNPVKPRCAHWGNYGVVASMLIETPHHGTFTPIIGGEFDMRYAALLEWTCGKGRVIFSQLDLTGRVGIDPAATQIAHNLLSYACNEAAPRLVRRAAYIGGPNGRALVARLGLDIDLDGSPDRLPERGLLILGEGLAGLNAQKLDAFTKAGGWIVALPRKADEFNTGWLPFEVKTQPRKAHRDSDAGIGVRELFDGLSPADFHWRDAAEFHLFAQSGKLEDAWILGSGFFLLKGRADRGGWLLCQADPAPFENAGTVSLRAEWPAPGWSDQPDRMVDVPKPWLRPSLQKMDRMYAQILTNLGAGPSRALSERVLSFVPAPQFLPPSSWEVAATKEQDDQWSPAGWRKLKGAMKPDLAGALGFDAGIAVTRTSITVDRPAEVPLRVRFGWGVKSADILLNGTPVFTLRKNQWCPRPGNEIMLPLKSGLNELVVKMAGKFDVQLAVQAPPDARLGGNADILYRDPMRLGDDPYAWFAW